MEIKEIPAAVENFVPYLANAVQEKCAALTPRGRDRVLYALRETLLGRLQDLIGELAQEVDLSIDSFNLDDWKSLHRYKITPDEQSNIESILWYHSTFTRRCQFHPRLMAWQTHDWLVTIDGACVMDLQGHYPECFYAHRDLCPYREEEFTRRPLRFGSHFILKGMVPNSDFREFEKQEEMIPFGYKATSAPIEITRAVLIFRKTGHLGMDTSYAIRTPDESSDGKLICVHGMGVGSCKIAIGSAGKNEALAYLGIGAEREAPDLVLPRRY